MYCNNCGTQYDDGQAFCPNCGAPAENPAPVQTSSSNDANQKLPLVIGAAVLLLVVIIALAAALSGGQKKAVKNYFKYFEKGKSEKMYQLVYPKDVLEELFDDIYDDLDADEIFEIQDAAYSALWDGLKSEGKVKFSYEIKNMENLNKLKKIDKDDIGVKNFDKFVDAMDDYYDDYDFDADKIKKAYAVEVKWELTVGGDKAAKDTDYLIVYKYKGKWFVEPDSMLSPSRIMNKLDDDDYEDVIEDVYDELKELWN